jgi:putative FmdB family regulatory protein
MATYDHLCENCNQEFELEYSVKVDPPTLCPLCNFDGKVKRLISFATPGKVELTGDELTAHIKQDAKRIQREAALSEKKYSNLIGEARYNQLQTKLDRRGR